MQSEYDLPTQKAREFTYKNRKIIYSMNDIKDYYVTEYVEKVRTIKA